MIWGDIIGSPCEFDMGGKTKDFPLFSKEPYFTDDLVMTIAVAEEFMGTLPTITSSPISIRAEMGEFYVSVFELLLKRSKYA